MARQSLMWTALPNGYSTDGTSLRVSVLLSPRLEPQAQPNALSSFFPDWEDWPETLRTATFTIAMSSGGSVSIPLTQTTGPNRVDISHYGAPESAVWKALFPDYVTTTEVLGRAMIAVARSGYPKRVLENRDINAAGAPQP